MVRTIVCFGDSNTWGQVPGPEGGRVATYSDLDGSHVDEAGHLAVGAAVERRIRKLLA